MIDLKDFKGLKKDSEIQDKNNKIWTVLVANCGGPGKYPTHLLSRPVNSINVQDYVFHNGTHMRFLDDTNKEDAGAICGDFERERPQGLTVS